MEGNGLETSFNKRKWSILILFGLIGQIAWSVENMYFNLFVFDTVSTNLDAITLMVQLSGIVATVVTLIAGTLSDKLGCRRWFISVGYIIWGVTVSLFGFMSDELVGRIFGLELILPTEGGYLHRFCLAHKPHHQVDIVAAFCQKHGGVALF